MKYLKILFSVIIIMMFIGCQSETTIPTLAPPTNLEYDGLLTWDEVDNASSYDVYINTVAVNVNDSFYAFEEEGQFTVYVIAKASGFINSDASESINVEIDYENNIDFTLSFQSELLTWNEVEDASSYNVFVDGVKQVVETNSLTLNDLTPGVISFTVQAVYPIGVSNISDILYVANDLVETEPIYFQYSKNSTMDIIIWEDITNDDLYLQNSDYDFMDKEAFLVLDGEHLEIKSDYLVDRSVGTHKYYLIHDIYSTLVEINITNNLNPYIISSTNIDTSGDTDIYLQYELFGGSFYSVNGNIDDDVLYHTDNNILIIEKEFITSKFEVNDMFVLSYVINKDENSVVGYLFINLMEE